MKKPALSPLAHAMIRPAESRKPAEAGSLAGVVTP